MVIFLHCDTKICSCLFLRSASVKEMVKLAGIIYKSYVSFTNFSFFDKFPWKERNFLKTPEQVAGSH